MASKRKPKKKTRKRASFEIAGVKVQAGTREDLKLQLARLPTGDRLSVPTVVLHGSEPGPKVWLDAVIHGDELNGLEVIHRALDHLDPKEMAGTLLAVPIVNVFGFVQQTRYLPDRRDLNRCFPGSSRGSLASRIAHLFLKEIVSRCEIGLDFHTGSLHRTNLPQIRADLTDPETRKLAEAFGAPLMYHAKTISGSLRASATDLGAKILVYEAGEPLRFDEEAVRLGFEGTLRVLEAIGMVRSRTPREPDSFEAAKTGWIRASRSGILHLDVGLGEEIEKKQTLAFISDPVGKTRRKVTAPRAGKVMGFTNNPLVHQGDAVIHIASAVQPDSGN